MVGRKQDPGEKQSETIPGRPFLWVFHRHRGDPNTGIGLVHAGQYGGQFPPKLGGIRTGIDDRIGVYGVCVPQIQVGNAGTALPGVTGPEK